VYLQKRLLVGSSARVAQTLTQVEFFAYSSVNPFTFAHVDTVLTAVFGDVLLLVRITQSSAYPSILVGL
jgi:hypothetical protein